MKDIRQVLRRKQAQQAQLAKEIALLQQAEETLREVASLLADEDEESSSVLSEVEEEIGQPTGRAKAASASAGGDASASSSAGARTETSQPESSRTTHSTSLRWP